MVIVFLLLALAFFAFGLFDVIKGAKWLMYAMSLVFFILAILKIFFDLVFWTLLLIGTAIFVVITIVVMIRTSITKRKSNDY